MGRATATSGGGRTRATIPSGGGGGAGAGGGGGGGLDLSSLTTAFDPGLLRDVMLQSLEQRKVGFNEWLKNQQQKRWLAEEANRRAGMESTREEDLFRNRNLPASRSAGGRGAGSIY